MKVLKLRLSAYSNLLLQALKYYKIQKPLSAYLPDKKVREETVILPFHKISIVGR